jgi:hypothetical protein
MWEPQRFATLWASTVSYSDNFTFFKVKIGKLILLLQLHAWLREQARFLRVSSLGKRIRAVMTLNISESELHSNLIQVFYSNKI